ncbi:MAG: dihydrofolate reductase [Flavobacteriales bacterium]|nr:dihydrofolate reductase [Flavobacteriales bacterium]
MIVSAIAAVAENGVIGRDGDLPWHLPDDLKYFQRTTRGHHVIMGRRNWESIPLKYRPFKDRVNIVVSRDPGYQAPGATVVTTLEAALELARIAGDEEAFIIGGGQIYAEALRLGLIDRLYLTTVHAEIPGDTHFPTLGMEWRERWSEHHPADDRHRFAFTFRKLEQ